MCWLRLLQVVSAVAAASLVGPPLAVAGQMRLAALTANAATVAAEPASGSEPAKSAAAGQPAANFKAVPFTVLAAGRVPGQQSAGSLSARDGKAFRQIWSDLHLEGPLPGVNFKRQMVVAWTGRGAACDGYKLTHVREDADGVSLEIEHSHPRLHQMCIALFAPSHVVAAIPQTAKPVKFIITEIPRT
jgi:hypothetical protein